MIREEVFSFSGGRRHTKSKINKQKNGQADEGGRVYAVRVDWRILSPVYSSGDVGIA